jgi:alpha-glucosidase
LRLPADWPPASVTVNGAPVPQGAIGGRPGWSFIGNTLTTVVPVATASAVGKVVIEVRRASGLTARRAELDGFAGSITRLRAAYDAVNQTWPVSAPPDPLTEAMQTGDRLSYHPERAVEEIAHFHELMPKAHASVTALSNGFQQRMDDYAKRMTNPDTRPADMATQKQNRLDALSRAQRMADEAAK